MPVIFNSVTRFVEQIGRRRAHNSNPTQLDTLSCIFIGPASIASTACPSDLTLHPEFPGMQCTGWEITNKEALMAEVRASYTGKLNQGSGPYFTDPVVSTSWHEGSVSWSVTTGNYNKVITPARGITTVAAPVPEGFVPSGATIVTDPGAPAVTQITYTIANWSMRFIAKAVTCRYLTNSKPDHTFLPRCLALALPWLGVETSFSQITGHSETADINSVPYQTVSMQNDLVDFQISDSSNGTYQITEVYSTRGFVNDNVHPFVIPVPPR